jgi:hypothetical protein
MSALPKGYRETETLLDRYRSYFLAHSNEPVRVWCVRNLPDYDPRSAWTRRELRELRTLVDEGVLRECPPVKHRDSDVFVFELADKEAS